MKMPPRFGEVFFFMGLGPDTLYLSDAIFVAGNYYLRILVF